MRHSLKKRLSWLAITLIFLGVYYGFLFDVVISAKSSLIETLKAHNMTEVSFDIKEFNGTTGEWSSTPKTIDLVGLIDFLLTIIIIFAPLVLVMKLVIP